MLELVPITLREANAFVEAHHRHHGSSRGCICCVAVAELVGGWPVSSSSIIHGVAIVGRPVARNLDDQWTAEVTRLCTDGTRNACSMLYAASWRAVRALGYRRLVTYTLESEGGASLRAAGFKVVGQVTGRSWSRASRPRVDTAPHQNKLRWEIAA